jgi:hypothetical protein
VSSYGHVVDSAAVPARECGAAERRSKNLSSAFSTSNGVSLRVGHLMASSPAPGCRHADNDELVPERVAATRQRRHQSAASGRSSATSQLTTWTISAVATPDSTLASRALVLGLRVVRLTALEREVDARTSRTGESRRDSRARVQRVGDSRTADSQFRRIDTDPLLPREMIRNSSPFRVTS